MTRVKLSPLLVLCLFLVGLGCSGNKAAPARVSGTLQYKGQAIKGGSLFFNTPEGVPYSASISPDGTYEAFDLPTGDLVVTVETESINPKKTEAQGADAKRRMSGMQQPEGGAAKPSDHYIKIPSKYNNPKTSPLTVTLTAGRQVKPLELTD